MNKAFLRKIIVYSIFLILFTAVQFSYPESLSINGVKPEILVVFCVLTGYMYGVNDAIVISLAAGYIKDSFSGRLMGMGILLCLFCGIVASYILKKNIGKNILVATTQNVIATIIYVSMVYISFFIAMNPAYSAGEYILWVLGDRFFPLLLLNCIASVIIYLLMKYITPYGRDKDVLYDKIKQTDFRGKPV